MNYILYHKGSLPNHLKHCINSILSSDSNSVIHLITDQKSSWKNIKVQNTKEFTELEFLHNFEKHLNHKGLGSNPLWITSLERIFYIYSYIEKLKITKFVHFDNDVVLYRPFFDIENNFQNINKGIHITPLNSWNLVFGYSFINSADKYRAMTTTVKQILEDFKTYEYNFNMNKPLNEMRTLSIVKTLNPGLFIDLPVLPYGGKDFVFDPASYGQYLGGTHTSPKRFYRENYITQTHIVGKELLSKRVSVNFNGGNPFVKSELGDKSKLVNLHIHSKELQKFLPSNYKKYIK